MILSDIGMLVAATGRTSLYLQQLLRHELRPRIVILLQGDAVTAQRPVAWRPEADALDVDIPVGALLDASGLPVLRLGTLDPNADPVREAVTAAAADVWIYSGPPGVILRQEMLTAGGRFLHVHPGRLPTYRGS